jgi:hypothetical protein
MEPAVSTSFRPTEFPRRNPVFRSKGIRLLVAALAMTACAGVAAAQEPKVTAVPPPVKPAIVVPQAAPQQEMQLADEIIRRLRRLGLNFSRTRLTRPYDPEGELC